MGGSPPTRKAAPLFGVEQPRLIGILGAGVAATMLLCAAFSLSHPSKGLQLSGSAESAMKANDMFDAPASDIVQTHPNIVTDFVRLHNAEAEEQNCKSCWNLVRDIRSSPPSNVHVNLLSNTANFSRPAPKSLNPHLLAENIDSLNLLQDMSADPDSDNPYSCPHDKLYVAEIQQCFVEGVVGLMWDMHANIYADDAHFFTRTDPIPYPSDQVLPIKEFPMLISVIQRYSNMYYHFTVEILPRIVAAKPYLDQNPEAKLLIWNESFIIEYLNAIGISTDRVEPFNPFVRYYADVVVYPYPAPRITPCKESLDATRQALGVTDLEESQQDLILYVSREGEMNRRISNEDKLIEALEHAFPNEKIIKYKSESDVDHIISLFQRAKLVIGPHGAGFSHILFSAPGTKVVELHFLKDPPMMFWHMAGALDLEYWIVPIPKAHWTVSEMEAPINEVVAVVSLALNYDNSGDSTVQCAAGSIAISTDGSTECQPCPPGTFKALQSDPFCSPCSLGQVSDSGSTYCTICPLNHYQSDDNSCKECPDELLTWTLGASSVDDCITKEREEELLADIVSQMISSGFIFKLDPNQRHTSQPLQRMMMYNAYIGAAP